MTQPTRVLPLVFALASALLAIPASAAQDWPQWLGPNRDGAYSGGPLALQWPGGSPPVLWSHEVGEGWSAPIVVDGKVVITHRVEDQDLVEALDASSGKVLWKAAFPATYRDRYGFDNGPRATPAAAQGKLYVFSSAGVLRALDLAGGKLLWEVDTHAKFKVEQGFFGASCSPLVEDGKVFLNIGGEEGAGLVAFDAATGEVAWQVTNHEASYSSPVAATLGGKRWILFFDREGLVKVEPSTGKVFYTYPLRARNSLTINAATPVVLGDSVFVSASYHVGAALIDLGDNGPAVQWESHLSLNNHYSTSVTRDGFLYGYHGRQESRPALRCVRAKDGEVIWSQERFGAGSLLLAGDKLMVLREDGDLLFLPASPEGFEVLAQTRLLNPTVRAYPALAEGILYARDEHKLIAADLRPAASQDPVTAAEPEKVPAAPAKEAPEDP